MSKHEEYVKVVAELNSLSFKLQERVNRCGYLNKRMKTMIRCKNREQAEAYSYRINGHKPKILCLLERIEELETELRSMPREWIT